ncbi:MAG: hypothetical protein WBB37_05360 [bacterium]
MINIALASLILFSQYYGQNKIQYKNYNFHVLETEHFNIYFADGGEELAAFAEEVLEDGYEMLSEDLGMEVDFTIPAIIYNSPNDFSQTNITLELIEEAVGGFTEILKNRMVVPFTGDYEDFRHVLVHELTHVFQFVIFFPTKMEALFSGDIFYSIPLWVMEGHAEFSSLGWDHESDIFMRDLVMNNNVIPLSILGSYGGFAIYKEGQAFYRYVAEKYGREKVGEFVHLVKSKRGLEETFLQLFGVTVTDFNDQWMRYYQMQYFPKIELQENFHDFSRIVYDHKKTKTIYNTSTAISSRGDKIAFISDRSGIAEINIISSIDGQVLKKLVKAQYSSGYEGLHLYQGGLSWSPDDKYIAFAAKSKGTDVLYILESESGDVFKKLNFGLDGIYSPKFAPNGNEIVFSGVKDGYPDIYILDISSGMIENITNDIYTDRFPCVSSEGTVAFVSDRPDSTVEYRYGNYAVFLYRNGVISRLTQRSTYVASPIFDNEGGLYFIADYDTAFNMYWFSGDSARVMKRTDIFTGIYYPTISQDGEKIAFSYLNDYGYDVCVVKNPRTKMIDAKTPKPVTVPNAYEETDLAAARVRKYTPKFTFDYFVASAQYYSIIGFSGLGEIALSDILGNHRISIASNFYGSITDSDIFLSYWYLRRRSDFGFTLFQSLNYFREYNDLYIWRYLGGGAVVQYPFSRFFRVELGAYAYKIYETRWHDFFPEYRSVSHYDSNYNMFYPNLAFVFDNVRWGTIGPHSGRRVRLEGYATQFSDFDTRSIIFDYRRYFGLSPRASFAARLVLAGSYGPDPDRWSIGGQHSLRGYDYYTYSGSKLGFLNLEYRFPFIDRLSMSFPLPIEFRNIRGVLFADFGGIYSDPFEVYSTDNGFHLEDLKMGFGAGVRITFLYMIFKLDVARSYNFQDFTDDWKWYLTIGPEW